MTYPGLSNRKFLFSRPTPARRVRPRFWPLWAVGLALGAFAFVSLTSAEDTQPQTPASAAPSEPISFAAQIQPILAAHCFNCHGEEKRSGGLRFDQFMYAKEAGDSGKPIIGGTLETNELYLRVSSDDRTYRMPKNAPPLEPEEIEQIKRWVEQGASWPEPKKVEPTFYETCIQRIAGFFDRFEQEIYFLRPYAVAFLIAQLMLLVVGRLGMAFRNNRPLATGKLRALARFCDGVTRRELTLTWMLLISLFVLAGARGHHLRLAADIDKLRIAKAKSASPWAITIFGYPPSPVHPGHPARLGGTYYRGNCERNPQLFNNGNYLTAIFRVGLCNSSHEELKPLDPAPAAGACYVHFEIERAPGTSDALFSKEMMASVFLSETFFDEQHPTASDDVMHLNEAEPGKRWDAYFPLKKPVTNTNGLIYVYTGKIPDSGAVRADPNYAIKYDLSAADGKITADSELWMGAFSNPAFISPTPPGLLPFTEWFDYRPIPAITGENTQDPRLLGVEEYVKKGLIKAQAPPEASPSSPPAAP